MRRQLETSLTAKPAEMQWTLARTDHADADTEEAASALLRCVVRDPDPANVGRQFSSAAVELALASYPGFTSTSPPGDGQVYGVFTPGYAAATDACHVAVHADGTRVDIAPATQTLALAPVPPFALPEPLPFGRPGERHSARSRAHAAETRAAAPMSACGFAPRTTGDEVGAHADVEKLCEVLPGDSRFTRTRHLLPNLWAVNFVIDGILGQGVAYQARFDPQAKGLGEWLRSRHIDIPESFV